MSYSHEMLCQRAVRWLSGSLRCNPVYRRNASCAEIPDAIGWSSSGANRGSVVVECKTSLPDFYADLRKRIVYRDPRWKWSVPVKYAKEQGIAPTLLPGMGTFRWFMCEPQVISAELVASKAPDHGLVHVLDARRLRVVIKAPERPIFDYESEIRYLRFAIINGKVAANAEVVEQPASLFAEKLA